MSTNKAELEAIAVGEGEIDWQAVSNAAPARPVRETPIEIDVVARRCVYVNNYRVAGGKPYFTEDLPSHTLKTTLGEVLDAFTEKQIRTALREAKAHRDYYAAVHLANTGAEDNERG